MAIAVRDFALDEEGDLKIVNGDFSVEFSDEDHVEDILLSSLGHWKQFPLLGVEIEKQISTNQNQQQIIKRKIQQQLKSDGYRTGEINFNFGGNTLVYDIDFTRIRNKRLTT
jgi:hypothetical protein